MQISALNGAPQSLWAQNRASPLPTGAGQEIPTSAGNAQSAAPASTYTPAQFSNAVMSYLLANQGSTQGPPAQIEATPAHEIAEGSGPNGPDLPPGWYSAEVAVNTNVSGAALAASPPGLQVSGINAADAAKEITNTIGSNGELTLSDAAKMFGVASPNQILAWQWNNLTGGSGTLTTSQLTSDIANRL